MPTSLRMPVVRRARRCARKPRSSPLQRSSATPIAATGSRLGCATATSQPTSGSRSPRWLRPCGPKARTMSRSCRPRWRKPPRSRVGGAVLERQLGLADLEPGVHRVGGHRRLAAEAGGERKDGLARLLRQAALARERLLRRIARCDPDQPPRRLLRDPEAAALLVRERRDRHVAVPAEQRPEVAAEIGVAEQRGRPVAPRAPRASAPGPSRGAGAERRGRRHPRPPGPWHRASRRRRRSPAPPGTAAAAPRSSSRSAPPRRARRSGS